MPRTALVNCPLDRCFLPDETDIKAPASVDTTVQNQAPINQS